MVVCKKIEMWDKKEAMDQIWDYQWYIWMNLQKGMFLTFQGKGFKGLNFIDMEELSGNPNITDPTL